MTKWVRRHIDEVNYRVRFTRSECPELIEFWEGLPYGGIREFVIAALKEASTSDKFRKFLDSKNMTFSSTDDSIKPDDVSNSQGESKSLLNDFDRF